MTYFLEKLTEIDATVISIPISTRLSIFYIFIVKKLPGGKSVREEPDFGYTLTSVSNSSGDRIYAESEDG